MSRRNFSLFLAVGFLWGIPYLFIRVAVEHLPASIIVFSRVLIGALILIPIALRRGTLSGALKNLKYVIPYAIAEMVGPWILITTAEKKLTSGLAGLLVATVPIWSTIISSINGDRTVWHRKRLFGLVVGFAGVVLVVGLETFSRKQSLLSIGMILVAAVGYAWAVIMVTKKIPQVDGIAINGVAMAITAIFYLPFAVVQLPAHFPPTNSIFAVLALGFFSTALAFIAFFIVMKEIGPARASLVTYLNTAIAVLLGVIILGEPLTVGIVVGLPLVLVGSYFASRKSAPTSL
jgi:drug/metabolite transporter (DMT)-like permease